uniref:Fucosyltransferase N-terminal domain-containing protein n=1 Tax=Parascaris univalens TaxID=6257 RepID=A0A914ZZ48_PARUN
MQFLVPAKRHYLLLTFCDNPRLSPLVVSERVWGGE